ncbi:hypothetical protein BSZ39_01330 [Bowdeniella nasicola]|uniref:TIGR03089 family protein n=1 Tax=Bowdeniella nasicola TaxID=208480 RepID=A0A1Q5Q557_9ACTO|nr:TIGR03089 family protein [Bowdeniella nasicola]OKL54946.1 hypothetical protein BSZ39_01330 [Bowdeniella nasicola]
MPPRHNPASILAAIAACPGPALTWYSEAERVELTGAVLAQWIAKTANYLVTDVAIEPGATVFIDLPVSWRSPIWVFGTWLAGAGVAFREIDDVDVIVTDRPEDFTTSPADVLAVALPALAREFEWELPPMIADANADVMAAADQLGPMPPLDPQAVAVAGPNLRFGDLDELLVGGTSDRIMVRPANNQELVRTVSSQLLAGGSIVVIDPSDETMNCQSVAAQEAALPLRGACR